MSKNVEVQPIGVKVLLKPEKRPEKLKSGIIIPQTVQDMPGTKLAEVIAVGEKVYRVKVGDTVALPPYNYEGVHFQYEGEIYAVMDEEKILFIVK